MPRRRFATLSTIALAVLAVPLSACGSGTAAGAPTVQVVGTDSACKVDSTRLGAGTTKFAVRNDGTKVTEAYVYAGQGGRFSKVVAEVEDVAPGTTRTMTGKLSPGTYELACKPGQTGNGIRQRVTVK